MTVVDRLSLLHGSVVGGVVVLAAVGLVVVAVRPGRRWWRVTLPAVAAGSGAVVGALAWLVGHGGMVKDHYPPTFGLWIGGFVVAVGLAVCGWRSAGGWRRVVSVATVPLTAASAFMLINAHYGYWPTLGDVLGRPLPNQISGPALRDLLGAEADPAAPLESSPPTVHGGAGARPAAAGAPARPADSAGHRRAAARVRHGAATRTDPTERAADLHGVLAPLDIPAGISGFAHRPGKIYLPPAFFATPRPALPVIVMLGGTPGGPDDWTRGGFAPQTADLYATDHQGVAPILAFVDHNGSFLGDSECVDGRNGRAETFLATDVPRFLADLLHTTVDPQGWAVGGFSEGGTCAFELAVRHPDVYGAFLDFAGDWAPTLGSTAETLHRLYGGSRAAMTAHDPDTLLQARRGLQVAGWYVAGDSDPGHIAVAHRLRRAAQAAGIPLSEVLVPGTHNWPFAAAAFRAVLADAVRRPAAGSAPGTPQEARAAPYGT